VKPLGIKKINIPNAKHHPKESGKNVAGWWENIVNICKKRDRFIAKKNINDEIRQLKGDV
jgi:hypothetical protein